MRRPMSAAWVHVVREDTRNRNLLYIGTEMGAWASWDRGTHWVSLRGDLPGLGIDADQKPLIGGDPQFSTCKRRPAPAGRGRQR